MPRIRSTLTQHCANWVTRLALSVTLIAPLTFHCATLQAQTIPGNLADEIAKLDITSATVALISPYELFRSNLTEKQLLEWGCTFSSDDKIEIAHLMDILQKGKLVAATAGTESIRLRNGVFLRSKTGEIVKLLFDDKTQSDLPLEGTLTRSSNFHRSFHAANSMLQPLIQWTANLADKSAQAMRARKDCQFIK